jgi:hypothetical protein
MAWCPEALQGHVDASLVLRAECEPCSCSAASTEWQVQGMSVRGRSHAHRGEYRDDALAVFARDGLVLLAVADGAGSSALSRIGAAVTAEQVVSRTLARYDADAANGTLIDRLGTAMAHAVHDAAVHLHGLAARAGVTPSALRTTLILVALAGDLMLVSQVGDGAVLIQRRDGSVSRVGATRESGWAGEVTCFVPDACAMEQAAALRQVPASDVTLVALMTDGIDDPFHPLEQTGAALVSQWRNGTDAPIGTARQATCSAVLGDAAEFERWLSFEQRGEADDRTLVLAWRGDGPAA